MPGKALVIYKTSSYTRIHSHYRLCRWNRAEHSRLIVCLNAIPIKLPLVKTSVPRTNSTLWNPIGAIVEGNNWSHDVQLYFAISNDAGLKCYWRYWMSAIFFEMLIPTYCRHLPAGDWRILPTQWLSREYLRRMNSGTFNASRVNWSSLVEASTIPG